jgi:hypothetical protein
LIPRDHGGALGGIGAFGFDCDVWAMGLEGKEFGKRGMNRDGSSHST